MKLKLFIIRDTFNYEEDIYTLDKKTAYSKISELNDELIELYGSVDDDRYQIIVKELI